MIETALKVIFLFFVLVSIHEWGHFYFAKRAGILVREFAIGFGPKLFSHKKKVKPDIRCAFFHLAATAVWPGKTLK